MIFFFFCYFSVSVFLRYAFIVSVLVIISLLLTPKLSERDQSY